MGNLLTSLAKKNIQITLTESADLDVTAADEAWDNGLEAYLIGHKQELVNELNEDRNLPDAQKDVENGESRNSATVATTATIDISSTDPFATSLLQDATAHQVGDADNRAAESISKIGNSNRIFVDFETRSEADLKKVGGILYSEHPSTDILCLGIFDAGSMDKPIILTSNDIRNTKTLTALAQNENSIFVAHNAAFDQAIWANVMVKKYGYPQISIERWRCTQAKTYAHGLPGSLEDAAKVLNLPIQKDMEGEAIMLALAKPRKNGGFWTSDEKPEMFQKLYSYCQTDIEVTKLIDASLSDLNNQEQKIWFIDQRMNQQGIYIDSDVAKKANDLANSHKTALEKRLQEITNGEIETPKQGQRLLKWLATRGVKLGNTQAPTIAKALNDGNLPNDVRDVFLIWQGGAKSSLAKYKTILERVDNQGRIRDQLVYHRAHTGRWTSKGIQVHNLPKPEIDIDLSCKAISTFRYEDFLLLYPDVADTLSQSLRGAFIPSKYKMFFIGDYAQVEARVIAWLAGEQKVLEAFASGQDLYCIQASRIYGREITKEDEQERKVGKTAVLALGYQGGIGPFAKMAKSYGVDLKLIFKDIWSRADEDEKDKANRSLDRYLKSAKEPVLREEGLVADLIKQRWRVNNPKIVNLWQRIESAATNAVINGESDPADRLHWFTEKEFLYCKLPSGRCMAYPYPEVETNGNGKPTLTCQSIKGRESTYGGKLAENITQAVARDLLAEAILRLENSPFKVAFHIHDEIVAEGEPGLDLETFKLFMSECPEWAVGLPIAVDAKISERFGK